MSLHGGLSGDSARVRPTPFGGGSRCRHHHPSSASAGAWSLHWDCRAAWLWRGDVTRLQCLKCRRNMWTEHSPHHKYVGVTVLVRFDCPHCKQPHILWLCVDSKRVYYLEADNSNRRSSELWCPDCNPSEGSRLTPHTPWTVALLSASIAKWSNAAGCKPVPSGSEVQILLLAHLSTHIVVLLSTLCYSLFSQWITQCINN